MTIGRKDLSKLPVQTQSGQKLGHVVDYDIDEGTHRILRYHIKSSKLLQELFSGELIVPVERVVSLTRDRMIIEDAVVKEQTEQKSVKEGAAIPFAD